MIQAVCLSLPFVAIVLFHCLWDEEKKGLLMHIGEVSCC
jgi:hypothetical protein